MRAEPWFAEIDGQRYDIEVENDYMTISCDGPLPGDFRIVVARIPRIAVKVLEAASIAAWSRGKMLMPKS